MIQVKQHKSLLGTAVLVALASTAECIRLRNGQDTVKAAAEQPGDPATTTEWTVKNIVGLVGAILVILALFLSFIFVGKLRGKSAKLRILQVAIVEKLNGVIPEVPDENAEPNHVKLPISAVLKVNSETPHHFVVPVDDTVDASRTKPACEFQVERTLFEATTFSLIVREGNIPIHFETLAGSKLARLGKPVPESKNAKQIVLENVQPGEAKLRDKNIVLVYEIL